MDVQREEHSDPGWAWAAYEPNNGRPWTLARAGHLFRRAAFGADWKQLQQALKEGPQRTVDRLLKSEADVEAFNASYDDYEASVDSIKDLRAWWLRRMIQTPHPLLEKMTLFWHSHFVTSAVGVKNARLMRRHIQHLRSQALGSFKALLDGITRDPAVYIWLDAEAHRKALPNDRFVRPLMQTFTLGPGGFTEKDVQEAARAFSGWFVFRDKLRFIPREHDDGVKRILGQNGSFKREDVVRILLERPATPLRIVRKLYRWLINETEEPADNMIVPLADAFATDYNILTLTEKMLRSNLFFSSVAYRQRVKSPVEFALGVVKGLEGVVSTTHLAQDLADLGQNLYHPPTVEGWTGGRHWIHSASITGRYNLALALLKDSGPYEKKLNPRKLAEKYGCSTPESASRFLLELFLQDDVDPGVHETLSKMVRTKSDGFDAILRRFTHAIVTLPEFHLA